MSTSPFGNMGDVREKNVAESTSSDHHLEKGAEVGSPSGLGGTDHDEHEMRMLGRTQQLNVSRTSSHRDSAETVSEIFVLFQHWGLPAH